MARISGIDLPRDKRIEVALTYIYGIGPARAKKVLEITQIDPDTRVKDLTEDQEAQLRDTIEHHFLIEPWPACSRPAHQDQRPYPQGSEEDHR